MSHHDRRTRLVPEPHRALLNTPQSRRRLVRNVAGLGLSVPIAASLLTARGAGAQPAAMQEATGGQAVINLGEPDTLFAPAARSALAGWILSFIANGLTKLRRPDMEVVPDLAESWEVSEDGRTYTFSLHQGVRWQDGEPFSAADVKFTVELASHPEYPGPLSPNLAGIEGAQAYKDGEAAEISGVTVIDDTRVEITLVEPNVMFLATTAVAAVLPRHILGEVPPADVQQHAFARQPIYTGPFMVEEWRTGDGLTFTAFADSFAGRPRLDSLVTRNIPDPATGVAELRAGSVQLGLAPPDQFNSFVADEAYQTQELAGGSGWFLQFDLVTTPLFSDPLVRQAMSHAIDRQAIIDALFLGRAEPNFSLTSPLSWIHDPNVPRFEFDLDRANALMDKAGWTLGANGVRTKDGQRFEFTMNLTQRFQEWALALQPMLAAIGITYQLNVLEFGTWISQLEVGKFEGAVGGWINFIIDPRADLPAQFESPRPVDASGYDNEQVNELFEQARLATSRENEKELYDQIQQIVGEDAVDVYLWRPLALLVVRGDLSVPEVSIQAELYARLPEWEVQA